MSSHFAKPENALRKAKDMVATNQPEEALRVLHNILTARRYRTWQATHEKIMYMYVDLSVQLRKNMKDGLVQYRMICQQTNMTSLRDVLEYYKKSSEERVQAVADELEQKGIAEDLKADVDDDEESPENLLLMVVSHQEDSKSRGERQVLAPWVKYMWETYRTVLDVLRNNMKLLPFYHEVARAAFKFCLKYKRHTAFRRLCEILRLHLDAISGHQQQVNAVDLTSVDTQKLYLETRFQQLHMAADLELWQEAYRTIEDIHKNMAMTAKTPDPALMVDYYEKLGHIFWASGNYLFHAYSLNRLYLLKLQAKLLSDEERCEMASCVLLACLSVPPSTSVGFDGEEVSFDVTDEGNLRLANLLGFKKEVPSRSKLLATLQTRGVLNDVLPHVKQLYKLVEEGFRPLTMKQDMEPLFEKIGDSQLCKYIDCIRKLAIVRLLEQLGQVYKSMRIENFLKLISLESEIAAEREIMKIVKRDQLQLRLDHRRGLIIFGSPTLEGDALRSQLIDLSRSLTSICDQIDDTDAAMKMKQREHVFAQVMQGVQSEHREVYERTQRIEIIKQDNERMARERAEKEAERLRVEQEQRLREERARLKAEAEKRELERIKREQDEAELKSKRELAAQIEKRMQESLSGAKLEKAEKKIKKLMNNVEKVDRIEFLQAQADVLEAEKREKERRQHEKVRRHDYMCRAQVIEEKPRLEEHIEEQRKADRERYREQFDKYRAQQQALHESMLADRNRLGHKEGVRRMKRDGGS